MSNEKVNHFRPSWWDRCCSLCTCPHSGRDEEDYEALETVRNIMTEGKKAGALDS